MDRNRKLKYATVILTVLLAVSISALAGVLLYNHFAHTEPATVDVPGNIITPEGDTSADTESDTGKDDPSADSTASSQTKPNDEPSSSTAPKPSESSVGTTKASALSLHTEQPEDNTPFQASNMFPGDSETKYYRIKVSYKGNIVVRYYADIRPGYEKLAEVLKVKIRLPETGETLYDGLMRDMPKSLNHALYTNTKTQSELYYEITAYLDTSVGNEYQDKDLFADFRWWVEETGNLDSPQTGDDSHICLWIALAAGSLLVLIVLFAKRRKEAADEQ